MPNPPYFKPPYEIGTAIAFLSDSEITSAERTEGDLRGLPGNETVTAARAGDFVQIPPHAWHYWLNRSAAEAKLVWFAHFHDRGE